MGIFQEMVEIVNRTSRTVEVIFDGQRIFVEPNYTPEGERIETVHNMVPTIVIPYALNQNVLMGSEDAVDPSHFESVIGVVYDAKKDKKKHSWNDCSYLEQSDALTRTPLEDVLEDPTMKVIVKGKIAPKAVDAGLPGVPTPFDPR